MRREQEPRFWSRRHSPGCRGAGARSHFDGCPVSRAEPDHARSVNGRAAEPKNSVGERLGACLSGLEEMPVGTEAESVMAECLSCAPPRSMLGRDRKRARHSRWSIARSEDKVNIPPAKSPARAAISQYPNGRQGRFGSRPADAIGLQSPPLKPTFSLCRDVPRKVSVSFASGDAYLHILAPSTYGSSAPFTRAEPPLFGPLPHP
jgi:hypothetical protein